MYCCPVIWSSFMFYVCCKLLNCFPWNVKEGLLLMSLFCLYKGRKWAQTIADIRRGRMLTMRTRSLDCSATWRFFKDGFCSKTSPAVEKHWHYGQEHVIPWAPGGLRWRGNGFTFAVCHCTHVVLGFVSACFVPWIQLAYAPHSDTDIDCASSAVLIYIEWNARRYSHSRDEELSDYDMLPPHFCYFLGFSVVSC